jgi:DNA polymerase-3 subunit delta
MVAFKGADIARFVARPDPGKPVALIFGPDAGLVRERTDALVRAAVDDPRDPFALALIDGDTLAETPERLLEEAHTVALFGGRRAVLVKAGPKSFTAAVERLLASPPGPDCRVVIEAGDLRRGAALRSLCERAPNAAALPCYADDDKGLVRLVEEELHSAGISIAPDARATLVSLIGGDRGASRSEIRKLALYAHGKSSIDLDDVIAVVADATTPALDGVIDAAFAGKPDELETNFAKARSSGVTASAIAGAAVRQAAALHRLRLAMDSGASARGVVEAAIPAIHFSRKDLVQAALTRWSAGRLERMIAQLGDTALDVRQNAKLAYPLVQRALLSIADSGRRKD